MCTVMAFLFTSCGKSAAKKDHVSHQVNSNTNVSESELSDRKYSGDYDELEYPIGYLVRKVNASHEIILNSVRVSVDFALRGWQVGLRPNEGNTYDVFLTDFCSVLSI